MAITAEPLDDTTVELLSRLVEIIRACDGGLTIANGRTIFTAAEVTDLLLDIRQAAGRRVAA